MARYIDMPGVDPETAEYAAYLEGLSPSDLADYEPEPLRTDYPSGLDGHEIGAPQIGDINGLSRTNYFNGRYLDAEALRRDQVYFARRDRVVAQTEHAGIAWGLGLDYPHGLPVDVNSDEDTFSVASPVVLRPGVAFDGEGRPIVVDRPFGFTLGELLAEYAQSPSRAVKPRSRFQPCICVERLPGNESVGPEYETGAYILVISPVAHDEGSARVYADPCARDRNVHCDADAWRHGFRLSLVRYDVFQHEQFNIQDSCTLRGWLAAHYFDRWEHDLLNRWRPTFAEDRRFCEGLGPFHRAPGAVALAMCFVTSVGDVTVFDPWIPRRYQISSASKAWEAAVRGAPTPTASVSRRHQFQCQLADCLHANPYMRQRNLYGLGFRHLAPCGFLPIDLPDGVLAADEAEWRAAGLAFHEAERIRQVRERTDAYFEGTNLLPRYRVAVYEDDIFEEMDNAAEKDPMVVRQASPVFWNCLSEWFLAVGYDVAKGIDPFQSITESSWEGRAFSDMFGCLLEGGRHTVERVVNREFELVDVLIPLYGRRRHNEAVPVADELRGWSEEYGVSLEGLTDITGDSITTREFVFFVKRRVVLDDWIYLIIDAFFDFLTFMQLFLQIDKVPTDDGDSGNDDTGNDVPDDTTNTNDNIEANVGYVVMDSFQPGYDRTGEVVIGTNAMVNHRPPRSPELDRPEVRMFVSTLIGRTRPELHSAELLERFDTVAAKRAEVYTGDGVDDATAARRGRNDAIDIMLEEYPGFADYKALAVLDPGLMESVHADMKANATAGAPVAEAVFDPRKVAELDRKEAAVYRAARASFGEVEVTVGDRKLRRNDILRRTEGRLAEIDKKKAKAIADETAKAGRKLERATLRVAKANVAGPKLAEAYEAAVIEVGEEKALDELAQKRGFKTVAKDLATVKEVVGTKGLDRVMLTMRNQ